ncbi:hypothetical protein Adt_13448 [Abeliophyllum distichum]|uniref:Uncharacterized protein n=1 Tax=Abeliophyllum distichum TaxID=126358 RepID=A0ABD1TWU3_9LAMI
METRLCCNASLPLGLGLSQQAFSIMETCLYYNASPTWDLAHRRKPLPIMETRLCCSAYPIWTWSLFTTKPSPSWRLVFAAVPLHWYLALFAASLLHHGDSPLLQCLSHWDLAFSEASLLHHGDLSLL